MLQAHRKQVTRHVDGLTRGECRTQELNARFNQLMCLVEDRGIHRGQEFSHAAVAQGHVGKEQMVVDDHQVGRHGLAPGLHHVAGAVLGALGAQAVLARGADQGDDRRPIVQAFDFGQVTAARALRPLADTIQCAHGKAVGQCSVGLRLL